MTVCGVLSEPIRENILAVGRKATALTRPYFAVDDVLDYILPPQDRLMLTEAWNLMERTRGSLEALVRLRDVGEDLQSFQLHFVGGITGVAMPDYVARVQEARGSLRAQDKILVDVMKSYHVVSRVRVALYVFDELDKLDDGTLNIAHLRYHLDWLPALVKPISARYQTRLEGMGKGRSQFNKNRRQEYRAIRDAALKWEDRLDETSDRWYMPTPVHLRAAIKEAQAAMATIKVLEHVRPDGWTPPPDMVRCDIHAPFFFNHTVGKMPNDDSMGM